MKKSTKRLLGGLALAAGAFGAGSALLKKRKVEKRQKQLLKHRASVWARPGMSVTFRAEVMPGRETHERTFQIKEFLPSGRVLLHGVAGEHAEKEFEPLQ
jgi:hypothetical protein